MCGRFTMTASGRELAEALELETDAPLEARYNIAPTQSVAVFDAGPDGRRRLAWRQWGLIPRWADDPAIGARLINARSETAAEKPAFREAFRRRRCALPATGFYEWARGSGRRGPVWFHPADERPLAFAGLWEHWRGPGAREIESVAILTTAANRLVAATHGRMPVILDGEALAAWLAPGDDADALGELLRPCEEARLLARPVSTRVNDAGFDDPSCIQEEAAPGLGPLFDGLMPGAGGDAPGGAR